MTNQAFDLEVITDDESPVALTGVLDEELEVAAGGGPGMAEVIWGRL